MAKPKTHCGSVTGGSMAAVTHNDRPGESEAVVADRVTPCLTVHDLELPPRRADRSIDVNPGKLRLHAKVQSVVFPADSSSAFSCETLSGVFHTTRP